MLHIIEGHQSSIYALEIGKEGRYLYSADGNGQVVQWDLCNPYEGIAIAQLNTQVFALKYIPELNYLAIGSMKGELFTLNLEDNKLRSEGLQFSGSIFDLKWENQILWVACADGMIYLVNPEHETESRSIKVSESAIRAIGFYEMQLLAASSDHSIHKIDLLKAEPLESLKKHTNSVFSIMVKGDFLFSGSRDAHIIKWNLKDNSQETKAAHLFTVNSLALSPNGNFFASGSRDSSIKIWDAETFKLLKVVDRLKGAGHANSVNKILWTDYKNILISASDDRKIMLWEFNE